MHSTFFLCNPFIYQKSKLEFLQEEVTDRLWREHTYDLKTHTYFWILVNICHMENPDTHSYVVIAWDSTKDRSENDLKLIVDNVRNKSGVLGAGHKLLVLGLLYKVPHPMGYQTLACLESFAGTNLRAMEDEVRRKVEAYASMLLPTSQACQKEGVSIEVKVTAGFPVRQVILQEIAHYNADWIILDRHLRRDLRYHLNKIPCKVALTRDDFSVEAWRSHHSRQADMTNLKPVYSLSHIVSLSDRQNFEDPEHSIITCRSYPSSSVPHDTSDLLDGHTKHSNASRSRENINISSSDFGSSSKPGNKYGILPKSSDAPILCAGCGTRTALCTNESMRFSYSDIQKATNNFSNENLLGEGGYGHVYKGVLRDGQQIAAKVRKEESRQGFSEFNSEIYVLSFARHKNIVMLLGYCCKGRQNILVYEYICNKSLHWHLYDKNAKVLEWDQRYGIAIGTAKGLRFLHEECRGGPIIHRDMRPSNILLTHDFVPMLGDFGLAKWKMGDETTTTTTPLQTRIMGTLGYVAPEYAEEGIVTVGTDVYAYGMVVLQLISGRKMVVNDNHLRQWAEPLIEKLALRELVDARLGESYDTNQLFLMAKAAYFCVQRDPHMRPSMAEVVRLLEGPPAHLATLGDKLEPCFFK